MKTKKTNNLIQLIYFKFKYIKNNAYFTIITYKNRMERYNNISVEEVFKDVNAKWLYEFLMMVGKKMIF